MTKKIFFSDVLSYIDKKIDLFGWVDTVRSHGKIVFLDLRDHTAVVQVVLNDAKLIPNPEDVVHIEGTVVKRPEKLINPTIMTGTIEIQAEKITILSAAKTPPFPLDTGGTEINEELRLRYRYLDYGDHE